MLPGPRRVTLRYQYSTAGGGVLGDLLDTVIVEDATQRFEEVLTLEAVAGRTYAARFAVQRPGLLTPVSQWKVTYWIEESATGAVVAGTRSP